MQEGKFARELRRAAAEAEAHAEAMEKMNHAKDLILDRMVGVYFRVEQLRNVIHQSTTVAEVVNRMPTPTQMSQAFKFSWTQPYMVQAFYDVMREDGEQVDPEVLGNLDRIEGPKSAPIARLY